MLYWRRDHAHRASRAGDHRAVAAALGPDRRTGGATRWRAMYVEYVYGFVQAIRRAPLTSAERNRCLAEVARWFWSCLPPGRSRRPASVGPVPDPQGPDGADTDAGLGDMGETTLRVATYGYFGMGNIGNEGSLAAFLAYLREAHPEAAVSCFAADADAVRRDHGVPATRLMAFRPGPGARPPGQDAQGGRAGSGTCRARSG